MQEEMYFCQSKYGLHHYKKLYTILVKNEFHDWKDYVVYEQQGSGLVFAKPVDMFNQEFTKL